MFLLWDEVACISYVLSLNSGEWVVIGVIHHLHIPPVLHDYIFTSNKHVANVMKCLSAYLFLLSTGHLLDLSKICPVCLRSWAVKTYTRVTFLSVDQRCTCHSCILHQAVEQPTSHWHRPCRKYPSICWGVLHRLIDDSRQIRLNGNDKFSNKITSHRHRIVNFVNAVFTRFSPLCQEKRSEDVQDPIYDLPSFTNGNWNTWALFGTWNRSSRFGWEGTWDHSAMFGPYSMMNHVYEQIIDI